MLLTHFLTIFLCCRLGYIYSSRISIKNFIYRCQQKVLCLKNFCWFLPPLPPPPPFKESSNPVGYRAAQNVSKVCSQQRFVAEFQHSLCFEWLYLVILQHNFRIRLLNENIRLFSFFLFFRGAFGKLRKPVFPTIFGENPSFPTVEVFFTEMSVR